jgi:hypothetical protein
MSIDILQNCGKRLVLSGILRSGEQLMLDFGVRRVVDVVSPNSQRI